MLGSLPDWVDVVIVDNASSDDSAELARRTGAAVVGNDVNAGFAAACNQGALVGGADFVLFLNPDAVVDGENLEKLLRRMEEDPAIGVASPIIRHPDGTQQRERWPFPSAGGAWREALGLHRLGSRSGDDQGFVIGACFLVRRSVFTEAGGFDTRYWLYGEEADFCRRIRDGGWRITTVDDATAVHVGGASSEPTDPFIFEHFCRGAERFVADHAGMPALLSFRLANLLGSAVRLTVPGSRQRRQLHQARLRRALRQLAKAPFSVGIDSPASAALGHSIVVCSLEAWDDIWRRNQFLVRELLDADPHLRVLFVEPTFDRLHRLTAGGVTDRKRGLRSARPDGRLIVLEPVKTLPRVLGGFADWSLRRQVRLAVNRLGFDDPTLWVNDASYAGLSQEMGWPTLYDITDDWLRSLQTEQARRRLRENEARLFSRAGAVVVCSADLIASRRQQRSDLELVPNAVDVEHFSRPQERPVDLPKSPVAVYVGTLQEDRLDIALIAELARKIPNLEIVLVGPSSLSSASVERLGTHRNVTLLGPRPYAVVPAYLQHADVVIVPHVVSPFTDSLDPIKAYECLAIGRPTIATPVAGFRALSSPVVLADRECFVAEVAIALARDVTVVNCGVPNWTDRVVAFAGALRRARDPKSRRTSVVFVDHCAQLSGAELSLVRLLPALESVEANVLLGEQGPLEGPLRAAGATVEVLELDAGVRHTRRDEVKVTNIGWRRLFAVGRDVLALSRRLREISPDIVHTYSLKAAIYGGFAGRLAGVPVIWHIHDRIATDYLPRQTVMAVRFLSKILPNEIIVNSRATGETLGPRTKYHVVPYAIAESNLRLEPSDPATRERPFRVAMIGRLTPWKGQHVFLESFARASLDRDAEAVIAGTAMFGENEYARALRDQVRRLGIADRVEFAGFVEDVPTLIRGVDVVVHASVTPEPFGQVVVEGMAASRAVIASAAGGPLEIITDSVDGILVPPGDSTRLAAALSRLAADPELRFRLGAAARERAKAFTPDIIGAMVTRVYSEALKRK